jgi:hypothetical protein
MQLSTSLFRRDGYGPCMTTWVHAALWGLFGSFAVEGLDFYTAVVRQQRWPWHTQVDGPHKTGVLGYCVAELIRLVIGGGLAGGAMLSGQIGTPFAAIALGIAAPLVVQRLSRQIPLTDSSRDTLGSEIYSTVSPATQQNLHSQIAAGGRLLPAVSELGNQRAVVEKSRSGDEVRQVDPQGDKPDQAKE